MNRRLVILGFSLVVACSDDGGGGTSAGSASMTAGSESGSTTMVSTSMATEPASGSSSASGSTSEATSSSTAAGSEATSLTDGMSSSSSTTVAEGSSGSSGSGSTTAAMCSGDTEPCPGGKSECCAGLDCCQGNPIPPGAEYCSAGICPISDRNKKENFAAIDPAAVLAEVAALEITTWNYRSEPPSVRHLGPMAQDFAAAFELGATDKSIFTIDADGVALASIQALHAEVVTLRSENEQLVARLERFESRLNALEE